MDSYTATAFVSEPFVAGDTYLVTWDGTDYECIARNVQGEILIGNDNLIGQTSNQEEPFVMVTIYQPGRTESEDYELHIATDSTSAAHTVAIRHVNVAIKPLDAILLPKVYLNGTEAMGLIDALNYLCEQVAQLGNLGYTPYFTVEEEPPGETAM